MLSYAAFKCSLQVGTAERVALRLVMQAEAVRRSLVQAGAQYRTFFSWLLIVLRRWAASFTPATPIIEVCSSSVHEGQLAGPDCISN